MERGRDYYASFWLNAANINHTNLNCVMVDILSYGLYFRRETLCGPSTGLLENNFSQTNALICHSIGKN